MFVFFNLSNHLPSSNHVHWKKIIHIQQILYVSFLFENGRPHDKMKWKINTIGMYNSWWEKKWTNLPFPSKSVNVFIMVIGRCMNVWNTKDDVMKWNLILGLDFITPPSSLLSRQLWAVWNCHLLNLLCYWMMRQLIFSRKIEWRDEDIWRLLDEQEPDQP